MHSTDTNNVKETFLCLFYRKYSLLSVINLFNKITSLNLSARFIKFPMEVMTFYGDFAILLFSGFLKRVSVCL